VIDINRARFDKEYSSQFTKEMEYLRDNGVRYNFVKSIDGISTYKYTKNETLFNLLAQFYREFDKNNK